MAHPPLIRLPCEKTTENFLRGFWLWVERLALGDYQGAIDALYWKEKVLWTPDSLRHRITTFFGDTHPLTPIIPNERLIEVVNEGAETDWSGNDGWGLAQIPLTNTPENPKGDEIMLMGLAASFFVRRHDESYVLEFEIFHA